MLASGAEKGDTNLEHLDGMLDVATSAAHVREVGGAYEDISGRYLSGASKRPKGAKAAILAGGPWRILKP
jgi:hypothetical protein